MIRELLRFPTSEIIFIFVLISFPFFGLVLSLLVGLRTTLLISNVLPWILLTTLVIIFLYVYLRRRYFYSLANFLIVLRSTMPKPLPQSIALPNLQDDVLVKFDGNGVPQIEAKTQSDAFLVLGNIIARDRLFQMDILRRISSGRMSEIFGPTHLENDKLSRQVGFHRVASKIFENLDFRQQEALKKYSAGINFYILNSSLSFEFKLCKYKPDLWKPEDSILVYLEIYRRMCADGSDKRMIKVMEEVLPKEVVNFFTTDDDVYNSTLIGGNKPRRPIKINVLKSLIEIARKNKGNISEGRNSVKTINPPIGSNHWAISAKKTDNGRAMLASDMHLELGLPNIWYRASVKYQKVSLNGVFLPGVPMLVAGSNEKIGWGFTRMCGDNLDLIHIEENPKNTKQYKTSDGWRNFEEVEETIKVKGGKSLKQKVRLTCWGPIYGQKLLGEDVALKWSALTPEGVNFNIIEMDTVDSIPKAIKIMNNWGGPPLNVMLADNKGDIAWTISGKFPNRYGFEGTKVEKWIDNTKGWSGFIPPVELPSLSNPEEGFIVTANNRTIGSEYPHELGYNYFGGYRAKRIIDLLNNQAKLSEDAMHKIQLDTASEFYKYYHQILINALNDLLKKKPNHQLYKIKKYLSKWDGHANKESKGFPLLYLFHQKISEEILGLFLVQCREVESSFQFSWMNFEVPLRTIIDSQVIDFIPGDDDSWETYFANKLIECANELKWQTKKISLQFINWGDINHAFIIHPLSILLQGSWNILNMKHEPMSGCPHCVNVSWSGFGVSERFVFCPGKEEEGVIVMPGGQSGHPLSTHYDDYHKKWVKGEYFSFKQNEVSRVTRFCSK